MLTFNIERFLRKKGEIPQTKGHTESLEDKWAAREWEMQSRCFLAIFLMAVKHYWCHYWALLWLLLILPPARGKEPLVVQSSLFALERQFEAISNSFPNLPRGFAGLPLQLLFFWETEKKRKKKAEKWKVALLSGKFIVILRMRVSRSHHLQWRKYGSRTHFLFYLQNYKHRRRGSHTPSELATGTFSRQLRSIRLSAVLRPIS